MKKISNKELQNRITSNILYYMEKGNVTIDDLVSTTKISNQRISNILNTSIPTTIKIKELYYISVVLGVSVDKLIYGENENV